MNECRKLFGWGLVAMLVAGPVYAHEKSPSAQTEAVRVEPGPREAAIVVDAFHPALAKGDRPAAATLLADDALVYESGGAERSKAEYAAHYLPADAAFAAATTRAVTRRSGHAAGDVAWIATESTTTGTFKDRPINSRSTETMVLRRENGAWRIAHIHWSSANVK